MMYECPVIATVPRFCARAAGVILVARERGRGYHDKMCRLSDRQGPYSHVTIRICYDNL